MSNVDELELDKFSQLAHKWWDKESEFKPLHEINPLRLGYIDDRAGLAGKTVLDVGCGGGILAESMALKGANVTGIDLAKKSLKVAQLHSLESGVSVDYRCVAVETLAEELPGHFDVVTCMEMLEHVPDPESVVRSCSRLVKPGGWVFFPPSTATPSPTCWPFWLRSTFSACYRAAPTNTAASSSRRSSAASPAMRDSSSRISPA